MMTPEYDKQSLKRLSNLAVAMSALGGKTAQEYSETQAKAFLKTATNLTPIAPKTVRKWNWYVNGTSYPLSKSITVKVKGRGFARSGWAKAKKRLAVAGSSYVSGKRQGYLYGHFAQKKGTFSGYTEVGNRIEYIGTLDRKERIADRALKYVAKRGEYGLKKMAGRKLERAWITGRI